MGMHCLYHLIPVLNFECTMTTILKLTVFWVESIIEKLSALTGTLCTCSQCSLITEWGGAVTLFIVTYYVVCDKMSYMRI